MIYVCVCQDLRMWGLRSIQNIVPQADIRSPAIICFNSENAFAVRIKMKYIYLNNQSSPFS